VMVDNNYSQSDLISIDSNDTRIQDRDRLSDRDNRRDNRRDSPQASPQASPDNQSNKSEINIIANSKYTIPQRFITQSLIAGDGEQFEKQLSPLIDFFIGKYIKKIKYSLLGKGFVVLVYGGKAHELCIEREHREPSYDWDCKLMVSKNNVMPNKVDEVAQNILVGMAEAFDRDINNNINSYWHVILGAVMKIKSPRMLDHLQNTILQSDRYNLRNKIMFNIKITLREAMTTSNVFVCTAYLGMECDGRYFILLTIFEMTITMVDDVFIKEVEKSVKACIKYDGALIDKMRFVFTSKHVD